MVIYLNDRDNYIFSGLGQGLLQGLNAGLNFGVRDYFTNKQFQNQLKRLNKLYDLQTQKAKELAKFKLDLENEQRKKLVRELLGQEQAQVTNLDEAMNPGNIQNDINTAFNNARQQGLLFGGLGGSLIDKAMQNLPQLNLPKPQVQTQYKGGVLSEYANKDPFIASSIKAQVYGINLPKPKIPKLKTTMKIDIGDKVAVLGIMDDGSIKFNKEFYKSLSPKEKKEFKLKLRELKEKVRHNLATEGLEKQKVNIAKKRVDVISQKVTGDDTDKKLKRLQRAVSYIFKKYNLDNTSFSTKVEALNTIEKIRAINPRDAAILEEYYNRMVEMTNKSLGIETPKPQKNINPFRAGLQNLTR